MSVLSVLYTSDAADAFDDDRLAALLVQCRTSNAHHDITGMLLYRAGRFVQVLEGQEDAVRSLLEVIERDPRHSRLRVLIEETIDRREFGEWTMGYQPMSAPPVEALPTGFRSTFDDLDDRVDPSVTLRAARELSLWFRVRASQAS